MSPTSGLSRHRRQAQGGVLHRCRLPVLRDAPAAATTRWRASTTWTRPASSASLNFPSFPRFCGQLFWEAKDKELALLCVKAYNDWMIDEWCGTAPGRFIPLIIIPLWDPRRGREEIERIRGQGRDLVRVLGEPGAARPAHHPRPWALLGPGDVAAQRTQSRWCCRSTSARRRRCHEISTDSPFLANLSFGAIRAGGHDDGVDLQRHVRALARAQDRAVRGHDRLDPVLHRAGRAGHRHAAALGQADERPRFYDNERRHRAGDGRPRPPRRLRRLPRALLRLLHRGAPGPAACSTSSARTT